MCKQSHNGLWSIGPTFVTCSPRFSSLSVDVEVRKALSWRLRASTVHLYTYAQTIPPELRRTLVSGDQPPPPIFIVLLHPHTRGGSCPAGPGNRRCPDPAPANSARLIACRSAASHSRSALISVHASSVMHARIRNVRQTLPRAMAQADVPGHYLRTRRRPPRLQRCSGLASPPGCGAARAPPTQQALNCCHLHPEPIAVSLQMARARFNSCQGLDRCQKRGHADGFRFTYVGRRYWYSREAWPQHAPAAKAGQSHRRVVTGQAADYWWLKSLRRRLIGLGESG
jgi:hypothetical protein